MSNVIYAPEQIFSGNVECGGTGKGRKLQDIFPQEVFNDRVAWYIDYFTEDGGDYSVRYLVEDNETVDNTIYLTNENKETRDPNEPWTSDDVIPWFEKNGEQLTTWEFLFTHKQIRESFGIHFEPNLIFAYGSRGLLLGEDNMWLRYIEDGILGPIKLCGDPKSFNLDAIAINPSIKWLENNNLLGEYLLGLAKAVDE